MKVVWWLSTGIPVLERQEDCCEVEVNMGYIVIPSQTIEKVCCHASINLDLGGSDSIRSLRLLLAA